MHEERLIEVESVKKPCKTVFVENVIDLDEAAILYYTLIDTVNWTSGIKSRKGFTRMQCAMEFGQYPELDMIILRALNSVAPNQTYAIHGVYLNYYRDGNDWTPNHSHPGTHQMVISLGATRRLDVAKDQYLMTPGSAIIFGSATHGVPKDPTVLEGRISIATFMDPIKVVEV